MEKSTEFKVKPVNPAGDAVSQLIEFTNRVSLTERLVPDLVAAGNGPEDVRSLLVRVHNAEMTSRVLWGVMNDTRKALLEAPDELVAPFSIAVLKANAELELRRKT